MSEGFGRQPNRTAYIKLFYGNVGQGLTTWTNTRMNNSSVLTPTNRNSDVLIQKNLIVEGDFSCPSDISLKTNIGEISLNTANNLLDVVPKQYIFKKDIDNKLHYGFIAQELEKVVPNLVQDIETPIDGKIKSVNYIEIIPLLLLKIKDLQNQIDEIKQCKK